MILTVHDELLFECERGEADASSSDSSKSGGRARVKLDVPLEVDVCVGARTGADGDS
jgi:DNA polymerase I-like protein with 3'-5' exonuclease and polymerase domains